MRKTKYKGPFSLKPDWSYSAPYTLDEKGPEPEFYPQESNPFIHAYNARAEARKARFLKDASQYLWTVGQELERYGFQPAAVMTNPAGIAVSGDIWAEFRHPQHERWIYLTISEIGVDTLGEAAPIGTVPTTRSYTTRKDRVSVMGRWREPPPDGTRGESKSWRSIKEGPNNWFDANLSSHELAEKVIQFLDITPAPAQHWIQSSLFDVRATAN